MQILLKTLLPHDPVAIGFVQHSGYWVIFESELVTGTAIFVPFEPDQIAHLVGQQFSVEPNYERVENFHRLGTDAAKQGLLLALPTPGCFQFTGCVLSTTPLIAVQTGDCVITLAADEINHETLTVGEAVCFDLVELSLWDENI